MNALGPIEILFLLAPVAVVPLAMRLSAAPKDATPPRSAARRLQPWAALAVVASFLVRRGPSAAVLAGVWLTVTGLVAHHGWQRLRRPARGVAEVAVSAGCLMLPIGGGWLVLSRLGVGAFGFEEPLVLLTAVHFHYAAYATLVLVGRAGRVLGESRAYRLIAGGAMAGPPLLAAGITFSPRLEIVAAGIIVLAVSGLGALTLVRIVPRVPPAARALLTLSSVSAFAGMACALAYALGEFTGIGTISLGQMARIHGPLNALGFVLAGLIGWTLAPRSHPPTMVAAGCSHPPTMVAAGCNLGPPSL
jgi:YndJ-like protein